MTEVIMPKMGDAMEEGTLVEWLKKEGEKVKSGEVIGTIQTDKATLELESPGSGILTGLLVSGGETVPVGKAIGAVVKEGESLPQNWGKGGSNGAQKPSPEAIEPSGGGSKEGSGVQRVPEGSGEAESGKTQAPTSPQASTERIKASPLAKKIAAERGVDLSGINGSGPGGRIVEKDVVSASAATKGQAAVQSQPITTSAEDQTVKLNTLRRITAQRTQQSKQQVPHFYVTVEVDVESIMELRAQFEREESGKVSINDFVVRACVLSLQQMPEVNSSFQGDTVLQHGSVHMGLAVALDEGLTVPVIKNAQSLNLRQLSAKAKELSTKARENKLHPDELSGSTFSISNMGMLDVDSFAAIINQPNSGILAIGSARRQVVANDEDEVEIRYRMKITGSFDHRVVDGAVGARFVNLVRSYLENPTRLLQ
jgi:pyruvate dehydrogenase E2 component (dihydrolipoamide acetyltransferase)